ncbi:hypothetical protein MHU86_22940 [Fragilaria crotonensis]|nr:hypothetical protein MHU86_22940 [Fragilaria crotonensis]
MAKLSSVDIWSKAPPSVKSPSVVESAGKETSSVKPQDTVNRDNSPQWPSLVKRPPGDKDYSIEAARMPGTTASPKGKPNPKSQTKGKSSQISSLTLLDEIDERADTASTHSLTNTLRSSTTTRMTELENQMRECRELLRSNREATQDSSDRLAANEQSLRETMETITEMTHTVAGLQTQFASFNITMESMRLMLHTLMHQASFTTAASGVLPFTGVQQSIQIPLSHMALQIPEVDGTTVPGTGDSRSIASGDGSSRYRRSPEKKKTRKNEEQQNSRAETSPMALDDVQMQLFDDELPNVEDTTTGAHNSVTDHRPEDTNSQLPLSTPQQNPSPPDAQYTNSSDPAGRDAT